VELQTSPLSLKLYSNSNVGTFYSDSACNKPLSTQLVPKIVGLLVETEEFYYLTTIESSNSRSSDIYYKDGKAGSPALSVIEFPRQKFVTTKMTATLTD
jgi:hypothetical protein